ncbi:MAG: hypothetical protein ACP5VN_11075 [Acidobacteriota bacterium]
MIGRNARAWTLLCFLAAAAVPGFAKTVGEVGGIPAAEAAPAGDVLAFVPAATFAGPKPPSPLRQEESQAPGLLAGGPIQVLLAMADDGGGEPLRSELLSYPDVGTVDVFDTRSATPTLSQLQPYNVVVVWTNYLPTNPAGLGDVLADYVDAGGRVILAVFSCDSYWGISGRLMTGGYSPLLLGSVGYGTHTLGTYDAGHPIMAGVISASDYYYTSTIPEPGATLVASWSDGQPFVATKGCVVAVNSYPGTYYRYAGDVPLVFHNAVSFLYSSPTCNPFTPDLTFRDDRGRAELCIQRSNGAYQWTNANGTVFTGTGVVANGGTAFWTLPEDPNYIYATYDVRRKRARGYWSNSETGGYNSLADTNTTNNPPCGSLIPE